jgi:hypothetical protein
VCGKSDRARAGRAQDLFFYISFLKLLMPLKNVYVCACVVYFFPPEREKKGGLTSPLPITLTAHTAEPSNHENATNL